MPRSTGRTNWSWGIQLQCCEVCIQPLLSALKRWSIPQAASSEKHTLAQSGTLEIAPMQAPLTLFIWSKSRILPVRLTEFTITEEAFDRP